LTREKPKKMNESKPAVKWQRHPSTMVAHAFAPDAKRGDPSVCKREFRLYGSELEDDPGVFPCGHCRKKLALSTSKG